jgi:drug/metabolite transporter (DMT)-like permease
LYLSIAGIGAYLGQLFISFAFTFGEATFLSPILYLNEVTYLTTDLVYFKYKFYLYDLLGGIMIVISLALYMLDTVKKYIKEKQKNS